jgi:hypothetical protein
MEALANNAVRQDETSPAPRVVVVFSADPAELAAARAEIAHLTAQNALLARALEQMYRLALEP